MINFSKFNSLYSVATYFNAPIQRSDGNAYRDTKMVEALHIDWLNKNMFDYRGLIPAGLANAALEGMYNS